MDLEALRQAAAESPTLENLRALRDAITSALRAIDTEAEGRDLTPQQAERWDALTSEHTETVERIAAEERAARVADSRARWRSTQMGVRVEPFDAADVRSLTPRESRDRALSVLDREDRTAHMDDTAKERLSRLLRTQTGDTNGALIAQGLLLTESDAYRGAFAKLVQQRAMLLTPEEVRAYQRYEEWRTMSTGTPSAGGYGVPTLIDPTIVITAQGHPNDILSLARVETITTDTWKGLSTAGMTWKSRGESDAASDGSPTLAQPEVPVHGADGYIPYTIEVDMDVPAFLSQMTEIITSGWREFVVSKLTVGTGSNQPTGIVTALDANTNVELATTTAATISAADINRLWAALPIRYRNPAARDSQAWMSSTAVNGAIQQLGQDAGSGFTVNLTADGVAILKGRRAFENDYMAGLPIGTAAANLLIVGDWRHFLVAMRAGMRVEQVQHVFDTTSGTPTGERALWAWARFGSDSINDLAFRMLQNKTS